MYSPVILVLSDIFPSLDLGYAFLVGIPRESCVLLRASYQEALDADYLIKVVSAGFPTLKLLFLPLKLVSNLWDDA